MPINVVLVRSSSDRRAAAGRAVPVFRGTGHGTRGHLDMDWAKASSALTASPGCWAESEALPAAATFAAQHLSPALTADVDADHAGAGRHALHDRGQCAPFAGQPDRRGWPTTSSTFRSSSSATTARRRSTRWCAACPASSCESWGSAAPPTSATTAARATRSRSPRCPQTAPWCNRRCSKGAGCCQTTRTQSSSARTIVANEPDLAIGDTVTLEIDDKNRECVVVGVAQVLGGPPKRRPM